MTLLERNDGDDGVPSFINGTFGIALESHLNTDMSDKVYESRFIHQLRLVYTNLFTCTRKPSPVGEVYTFVTVFDVDTWTCLLACILSVAGFLDIAGTAGGRPECLDYPY